MDRYDRIGYQHKQTQTTSLAGAHASTWCMLGMRGDFEGLPNRVETLPLWGTWTSDDVMLFRCEIRLNFTCCTYELHLRLSYRDKPVMWTQLSADCTTFCLLIMFLYLFSLLAADTVQCVSILVITLTSNTPSSVRSSLISTNIEH